MREKIRELTATVEDMIEAENFNLTDLKVGKKLQVTTKHNIYLIERRVDGFYISGNPKYCPQPTKVSNLGSTYGGMAIAIDKIVVDGYLEFTIPKSDWQGPITTSQIQEFEELE